MLQEKLFDHSRIHPLHSLPAWIKREDELSFGSSGNKLRKLRAIIEDIQTKRYPHVHLFGSAYSNFILSAAQHFIEYAIPFTLYLKKPHHLKREGNFAFLTLLVDPSHIVWIDSIHSTFIEHIQKTYPNDLVLPEGGECFSAVLGALSLSSSIHHNEQEKALQFEHVFIDAGTGIGAIGLILGAASLQKAWHIHVYLMCEEPSIFMNKLSAYQAQVQKNHALSSLPKITCHTLTNARSFGSVNQTLMQFIRSFAHQEGVFLDPFYSGKMVYEIAQNPKDIPSNSLIIHSGGALSLSGFIK